ncbi:hypothetical protein [Allorhizocola rhizosphaerae]|uniref:hypothetical protein n=1 Tax=Allorhizocola rhizosphaerae TaxID=1872709 RepID=UPI0013C33512|nr:hypothetical protein [Allorhizocola rhizosphaerae]
MGLAATVVSDEHRPDGTGLVTVADPVESQFRVEGGDAERVNPFRFGVSLVYSAWAMSESAMVSVPAA